MPRFIFITKTEQTYNFGRENIFITNIIHKNEIEQDLIKKIQKELWEIDCFYMKEYYIMENLKIIY